MILFLYFNEVYRMDNAAVKKAENVRIIGKKQTISQNRRLPSLIFRLFHPSYLSTNILYEVSFFAFPTYEK